jgi:hypothetical protein
MRIQTALRLGAALLLAALGPAGCHRDGQKANGDGGTGDGSASSGDLAGLPPGGCPSYQTWCNGACIAAANDPANCGGCAVACTGMDVCYSGKCVSSGCPLSAATGLGLTACGHACVDVTTDNNNCGVCGKACTGGTVCADGHCIMGIPTKPGVGACTGVGPQIMVATPMGSVCSGTLAQISFTWALCACQDVSINGNLVTDAFDSTKGPYVPGGKGGGVGMNGSYKGNQLTDVGGTLWTASTAGLNENQMMAVHQELYVNGPVDCNQQCSVALDAHVNGTITANKPMTIGQTLYTPNAPTANVTYGKLVTGPVTVGDACVCDPAKLVPVNAIVDARQTMNDNASIGLDPAVLDNFGPATRLDLPCGNYYLNQINTNASLTIVAHGHTALYVGGDIKTNQNFQVTVDPTGSFDVFVKATISTNQKFSVGSLNAPALMRLYLGSTSQLSLNQGFLLAGNLYSALSNVSENQTGDIYGAIFSKAFDSNQNTNIHYDTAVTTQGSSCPAPEVDGGVPTVDGGGAQVSCNTCTDCANQACVNHVCGACTTNADCCAPLTCTNGQCVSIIL